VAHSYANLCEVLIASGQIAAAGRAATEGLEHARRMGVEHSFGALLAAYAAEACILTGAWDRAEVLLGEESNTGNTFWAHYPNLLRAELAAERGDCRAAHDYIASAAVGERQPTSAPRYARVVAGLALWQCQPELAAGVIDAALARCEAGRSALHRARLGALGVRAQADRIGFASAHRDVDAERSARVRAGELLEMVRRAAADAIAITPEAVAWHAAAEAEYERGMQRSGPARWRTAVDAWESVGNSYQAAYCRWRLAEAALSAGTRVTSTGSGLPPEAAVRIAREAHRAASTLGAAPLRRALEALAERARIDLTGLTPVEPSDGLDPLGLTARQREVLQLLTRGYTNRQIAAELTISDKTASVHVTHILRRMGVARRFDAAAIAQRLNARQDNLPNIA
jgi:ATP/maltotriose-dependent transcriptional regulator MalT